MSKKVLIIGGEGNGGVIASCIEDNRNRFGDHTYEVAGFINDFEKGKIITCANCNFKMEVDDEYYKQVQDSIHDLQKTIADVQKKINKAFK